MHKYYLLTQKRRKGKASILFKNLKRIEEDGLILYERKIYGEEKWAEIKAKCKKWKADIYFLREDFKTSAQLLEEGSLINKGINNREKELEFLFRAGIFRFLEGNYHKAEENINRCIETYREWEVKERELRALSWKVIYLLGEKRFKEAKELYNKILQEAGEEYFEYSRMRFLKVVSDERKINMEEIKERTKRDL